MIRWFFLSNHDGRGAAIAVVLFIAIIPVMVWNVRQFREQRRSDEHRRAAGSAAEEVLPDEASRSARQKELPIGVKRAAGSCASRSSWWSSSGSSRPSACSSRRFRP